MFREISPVVVEAADLRSAMAALRADARGVDVAVLDVQLPDANGFSRLAALRRLWPVVVVGAAPTA